MNANWRECQTWNQFVSNLKTIWKQFESNMKAIWKQLEGRFCSALLIIVLHCVALHCLADKPAGKLKPSRSQAKDKFKTRQRPAKYKLNTSLKNLKFEDVPCGIQKDSWAHVLLTSSFSFHLAVTCHRGTMKTHEHIINPFAKTSTVP